MASSFSFNKLQNGIGEIRRAISTGISGPLISTVDMSHGMIEGDLSRAASNEASEREDIFTFGFDKWGSKTAKVGK